MAHRLENIYLHKKGKLYRREGIVKHSETLEEMVLYKPLYKSISDLWVRPRSMFEESDRFRPIGRLQDLSTETIREIPTPDYSRLDYLKTGTSVQRLAYQCLIHSGLWALISRFKPILAGTIPLDLHLLESDLDLLLFSEDPKAEIPILQSLVSRFGQLNFSEHSLTHPSAYTATFNLDGFEIEIFLQNIPTENQRGYRHLLAEAKLLEIGGSPARSEILMLKKQGLKTEPAFAKYFELEGDPYLRLLDFS